MNAFLKAAVAAINRNGRVINFTQIERVVDKIQGTVVEQKTTYPVKMYPKHIRASQYNFPDLIGKNVITFYLANYELGFTPKVNDTVEFDSKIFTVRYFDFHEAHGQNCLYRITGATG